MRPSDFSVYEFDVEFTQTIDHSDANGDHINYTKHPGTRDTLRLIAQTYHPELAEAWCRQCFKFSNAEKDLKITAVRTLKINGILELHV